MRILSGYQKPITALAVSPDGTRLYSGADGQMMIWQWDLAEGKVTKKLRGPYSSGVVALACSADGRWMLSAGVYSPVGVWSLGDVATSHSVAESSHTLRPSVAIHPDSRLAASPFWAWEFPGHVRTQRFAVMLWDLAQGKRVGELGGHAGMVNAVAFSPSGGLLASGSDDGTIRLWDHATAAEVRCLEQRDIPLRLAFRADGKALAVGAARAVYIWDLKSGESRHTLSGHVSRVTGIGYSPDGKHFASIGQDGIVCLYDAATCELVGKRHLDIGKLGAMCWLADSSALLVGGDKVIAVCEAAELLGTEFAKPRPRGEPLSLAGHTGRVNGLAYSPDGRALCSWEQHAVRLWDLSAGAGQARAASEFEPVRGYCGAGGVSWSPDALRLAYSDGHQGCVLDSRSGQLLRTSEIADCSVSHAVFTSAGRLFVAARARRGNDLRSRLELRDAAGEVTHSRMGDSTGRRWYIPPAHVWQDRCVYLAADRNSVYRWSWETDELTHLFDQQTQITALVVSDDGRRIVTTGGNTAIVRQLGESRTAEVRHPLICSGAALLPGGRLLTACYDGIVRVWDQSGGAELFAFELGMGRIYSLAVSPDFMTFAAGVHKKNRVVLMDIPD